MGPYWKRLASGKYIDMADLKPDDVDLYDVEVALNNIIRFTGHYKNSPPLTVAQHSLLCLNLARHFEPEDKELHKVVLGHDFAEAYIGDVATPVKRAMGDRWDSFAIPIEQTVEKALYGSLIGPEMHDRVKVYDLAALDIERRVMWDSQLGKDKWPPELLNTGNLDEKREWYLSVCYEYIPVELYWESLHIE